MTAPEHDPLFFTTEDANRMLPLVRAIVADIVAFAGDLEDRQDRLDALIERELEGHDPHGEEVLQMEQEIDADELRLDAFIAELVELGVELQDPINGEVDFRTRLEGQEALLCWKLGEAEVTHWHTEDGGFAGRRSLLQGAAASDDFSKTKASES